MRMRSFGSSRLYTGMVLETWVNLSRFLESRLRCTSAMSLSRHTDRWACRSRGCAATILSRSAVYIYMPHTWRQPMVMGSMLCS